MVVAPVRRRHHLIGAAVPTTTLFLGSIIFLMLIVMQFSIKLSELSDKVKNLAQENALLKAELQGRGSEGGGPIAGADLNG